MVWFYGASTTVGLFNAKYYLYIYIKYIGFGLVWFYGTSTTVGLFNAKYYLYIYIKYVGFGLVWFGLVWCGFMAHQLLLLYLMPNTIYTYILNI